MRDTGVLEALQALLAADPDVVDRSELGGLIAHARVVRGFVDVCDLRFARRGQELADAGESESPLAVLMDEGRRSGKEAKAAQDRDRVCGDFDGFEEALATGDVSGDHLDVLARLTKHLDDEVAADLRAEADELLASASNDYVSQFERSTKERIAHITSQHAPEDEAAELDRQRAESNMKRWTDRASGMKMTLLALDPLRDAAFHSAVDAQSARLRQDPGSATVPFSQIQVDAVVAAVSSQSSGRRIPELVVHVDHASLCHGRHVDTLSELSDGTAIPVATAQRLCCEAIIGAVVIDRDGTVRELCTEQRTANRAQRRALAAMYRTCAHPHCEVGFDHCRIHHIEWWSRGGNTVLTNLIPLCETHHHLVHEGGWNLRITPDRVTTWTRPDGTIWWRGATNDRTAAVHDVRPRARPPDRLLV
ncbi:HNH endonuclease signature motif containing protein [Ilumatobacter sp.]|uniref:HNH endonuclease signature motif containing protein n=1 Tax=Ilumatobacter sp. TaxID=1967498 RepID=UPI003AF6B073